MSDSSKKLQDEVPGELFFVVARVGDTHASPGARLYRQFTAAEREASEQNRQRENNIIRNRRPAPMLMVYAVFPRRKKDASRQGGKYCLVRSAALVKMTADERAAHEIQDKLMRAVGDLE